SCAWIRVGNGVCLSLILIDLPHPAPTRIVRIGWCSYYVGNLNERAIRKVMAWGSDSTGGRITDACNDYRRPKIELQAAINEECVGELIEQLLWIKVFNIADSSSIYSSLYLNYYHVLLVLTAYDCN